MGFFSSLLGGVVGFLVGGPVGAAIGAGIGATKVGEKIVNTVMDFVLQPFMPSIPDMGNSEAAAQREQGVLIQRQGSTSQIPVVYGYRKLGAAVSFAETGSATNKYLYVDYVLCEGTIEGLREFYIDDWQLPVDQVGALNGGSLVTVNADRYKDRVQLRFFPGVNFANPRSSPVGSTVKGDIFAEAPSFTSDMVYNGLAVIFARYEWREIKTQEDSDNNPFSGSIPKLQATVLGRKVASLQNATSEAFEYQTSGYSERYSTNPAEILLDYLRNPRYGKGMVNSEIEWDSFRKSAAKCNQIVEYVNGIRGPILTTNAVLDTASTIFNNTKLLLTNMRGYLPYVQGKYKLKIEDAGNETDILSGAATIVKTFNKDNIIGNITYTGIERNAKYTQVTVKYVDPDNKWSVQEVTYPEDEDTRQFYVSFDGGRENSTEITFSGCTNYAIAKDFARMIFNKSRFQDSLSFRCDATGFDLEPGDNIHVNANILKFSGEDKLTRDDIPWRIVSIKLNNDYTFDIGAVRNPDFLYPHTRVGEIDYVLPPYVPKGAEIYFPKVQRSLPYGLVPPTRSPHPGLPPELVKPVDLDDPTLPVVPGLPPTNPTGVDGGGVGGIDSPLNDINNPNNPPPPPPPVYKFDDIIDIINVSYSATPGSSATDATFTFIQPDHPQYHSIDVYYKIASNQITSYRHVVEDSKRGAGQELTFTLENLLANRSYVVITRVNYSTGDSSQGRSTSYIFPTPGTSTDVNEGVDAVSPGWDLPIADPVNNKDTYIEAISAQTLLTNGNPRNPRQINVTIRQYIA
jgi:hypothetical protein